MITSLRIQFIRLFSWRLLIFIIIFTSLHIIVIIGEDNDENSAWYLLKRSLDSGCTFFSLYFLPPLICSYTLADEWNSHASDYYIIRSGINYYTHTKIIVSAIGGFTCVFFGILLTFFVLLIKYPFSVCISIDSPYDLLVRNGHRFWGLFFFALDYALSGAVSATIGIACSTFILSPIVAVVSPLCLQMTMTLISNMTNLPKWLNAMYWMHVYNDSVYLRDAVLEKYFLCFLTIMLLSSLSIVRIQKLKNKQ